MVTRVVRSVLCWSFAVAAAALAAVTISAFVLTIRAGGVTTPFRTFGVYAAVLALAVLYACAAWSARQPRDTRNVTALAACFVNIAIALGLMAYVQHVDRAFIVVVVLLIVPGIAGMVVFMRGEAVPVPLARHRKYKRMRVPGDRTNPWLHQAALVFFFAATMEITHLWFKWANDHYLQASSSWTVSLIFIGLAMLTVIAIHESGHALAAVACGMKLLAIKIGPFQMRRREGRWGFKLVSHIFGGAVHSAPTNPDQPAWQDLCMLAGGPAANLCTLPIFLWAALHAQGAPWQRALLYLSQVATFSLVVPLCNLFPFRTRSGNYSDGARILQLLTNSPLVEYHRALHRLLSTLVTPLRFRDIDPESFQQLAAKFPNQKAGLHLHLCAVTVLTDAGRLPEASAALSAAEEIYNGSGIDLPRALHTSFIIDHAILNRDPVRARLWWDRMEAKKKEPLDLEFWIARTALLWIEGQLPLAEHAWQQANARAQKLPAFGAYEFDRSRCAFLREKLDEALQAQRVELVQPTESICPSSTHSVSSPS